MKNIVFVLDSLIKAFTLGVVVPPRKLSQLGRGFAKDGALLLIGQLIEFKQGNENSLLIAGAKFPLLYKPNGITNRRHIMDISQSLLI